MRNLNRTIETAVKLEALAQARLAESRQERAEALVKAESALDTRNEEEDSNSRGEQSLLTEQEGAENAGNPR